MGFFNVIKELIDKESPITKRSITIATAYGITAPFTNQVLDADNKKYYKGDKKLCCHCGAVVSLEDKSCFKCGKELGYINENKAQGKVE